MTGEATAGADLAPASDQRGYSRAILNILDDYSEEKALGSDVQLAMLNILDDFTGEKDRLESTQKATLNILEDFDIEKIKVERAFRDLSREGSERKRAEEALQVAKDAADAANSRLEQSNSQLESFSYSVAHDLRAPLRAIDGFSRILLEDHATGLSEEGTRVLGVVIQNVGRMGLLIDDLLSFSRLGRSVLSKRETDMTALVRPLAGELRALDPDRMVELMIEPLGFVRCDQPSIRQVWTNLLSNAFKFTRARAAARITVSCEERTDEIVYSISDNGAGFDMQYAGKLFGVFQRLHAVADFEGTGIGLAIVDRIVQRHGGRVWAKGTVDEGATFSFALPVGEGSSDG